MEKLSRRSLLVATPLVMATKAFAAEDKTNYSAIDTYMRRVPPSETESIPKLSAYILRKAVTDREKARAVFTWIAENFAYDLDAVDRYNATKERYEQRPEILITLRCAECGGHSKTFEALARACGLEAMFVGGRIKVVQLDPIFNNTVKSASNGVRYPTHAWNVVKIDGKWLFVDVTCSHGRSKKAGAIKESRKMSDTHFLVSPEQWIYTYLPAEDKYQFLEKSLTLEEHSKQPVLHAGYFKHQAKISLETPVVTSEEELFLSVKMNKGSLLHVDLCRGDGAKLDRKYVFWQNGKNGWELSVVFPSREDTILRVFAKKSSPANDPWDVLGEYLIRPEKVHTDLVGYPETFSEFTNRGVYLYGPTRRTLPAGQPQSFRVWIPGALSGGIKTGGRIIPFSGTGPLFEGTIALEPGEVMITGKFPDNPDFNYGLVRYDAQ